MHLDVDRHLQDSEMYVNNTMIEEFMWGISLKMHVESVVDDLCLWRMSLV